MRVEATTPSGVTVTDWIPLRGGVSSSCSAQPPDPIEPPDPPIGGGKG